MLARGKPGCRVARWEIKFVFPLLCFIGVAFSFCTTGFAQTRDLVVTPVNSGDHLVLAGHHPAWASVQNDRGAVPADLPLEQLALVLSRPPEVQQAFDQYLSDLQNPASVNYHHWLTPVEVGERFGASQNDINAIQAWLQSQNLTVSSVANNRVVIRFSGSASAIATTFGAEMHYFLVGGEQRVSISSEPQIPAALAGIIKSVIGLSTPEVHPFSQAGLVQVPTRNPTGNSAGGVSPDFTTSGGSHYLFPADFATIYNASVANITGAGQTIAIIGLARVYDQDILNFEALSGLAAKTENVMIAKNGTDPGAPMTSPPSSGTPPAAQTEATLDVTRVISIAPGATVDLVISANTGMVSGLDLAVEDVVDANPSFANIMSLSFGGCENQNGQSGVNFFDTLFGAAAMEGIAVFVSSGDSGAAECDAHFATPPATQILSPNFMCSSSHATCVGGTEFADFSNPSQYWSGSNSSTYGSALSYIPEGAWNEPLNSSNQPQVAGTGGGVSAFIPTPTWQVGTGVPGTAGRYTPDISFSASVHDGYFACMAAYGACGPLNGNFYFIYIAGTSASVQDMAGVAALLNQKAGSAQGELNENLYRLAATPSNNVFHDVTVASSGVASCALTTPSMCNNSAPGPSGLAGGLSGYAVGTGYDEATGLGSINVANLLANWTGAATTTTVTSSLNPFASGASVTLAATVTTIGPTVPTGQVNFFDGATQLGIGTLNGSGSATLVTSSLTSLGQHSITAFYNGDTTNGSSTSPALTVTVGAATFALAENSPTSQTISSAQSATYTLTVTPNGSYTSLVTFTCSIVPSSGTCMFSSPTVTPDASVATTMLTISGAQASAPNFKLKDEGAHRLPALYGFWVFLELASMLLFLRGNKYSLARLKRLSLPGALLLATLIMAGCGASSSTTDTSTNTPVSQTYQIMVTASALASGSGSSASQSQTQTVSLTVQ